MKGNENSHCSQGLQGLSLKWKFENKSGMDLKSIGLVSYILSCVIPSKPLKVV